ncbi:MAG TPA: CPBP family intramembrane glutamic endopeptidase, partial [Anaerolineaceae bacterium]
FSAAALAPFLLALAVRRQPLLSAGLSRRALRPGLELGVALGLITIFLTNRTYTLMNGLTTAQGLYFAAALVGAFAEEFIFRGYIQLRLMDWLGETWGWLGAAVLFALWRVPQALAAGTTGTALAASLAALLLFGLLLGWIMRRSGSILATALYHAVHNWILIL